jgi:hypothetical protein
MKTLLLANKPRGSVHIGRRHFRLPPRTNAKRRASIGLAPYVQLNDFLEGKQCRNRGLLAVSPMLRQPSGRIVHRIERFLETPVPPSRTEVIKQWKKSALDLGPVARPYLLKGLYEGSEEEQYVALLALRLLGYEAWGYGYNEDFHYVIEHAGRSVRIEPQIRTILPLP